MPTDVDLEQSFQRWPCRLGVQFLAIAALAFLLTLYRLGAADVCSYDEAVEGIFVQQMVEHGGGLFPLAGGQQAMYKPPLFHWTALGIDRLFGIRKVTAFNLRLAAAIYAAAGILLIVYFTYIIYGPRAAPLAGLALLASYQYINQGRFGRVDITLTFCEALALTSFVCWLRAFRIRGGAGEAAWRYLFALALGLGVLAKGPVGALLPLAAVAVFVAVNGYWDAARRIFSPGSALLALVVGLSWYAACFIGGRYDFLNRQLGSENLGRFLGTLGAMPPWYYVTPLLLNSAPLSLLAPIAVAGALITRARHRATDADIAVDASQFLAIFWVVTVVFFTLAAYKRRSYLLPLWPANAVLLAWWIESRVPERWQRGVRSGFVAICGVLIAVNLVLIPRQESRICAKGSFRAAAGQINRIVGADEPLFIYGMGDPAALMFYLDRGTTLIGGELGDAPPGYVIAPASAWERQRNRAPDLEPVLGPTPGSDPLFLLRHGKAYAGPEHCRYCYSSG
ncbi:MAG TPA: phospholipid carrier-dependent glycosyltransferase [Candidatus Binataceae bacterium]|nr:phospholipid carrier-dependent glycosyltransferase [Candidatus Binataceae bacterium]